MSDRTIRVGLMGATGAVGAAVVEALERSKRIAWELVPIASPDTKVHTLEFRGEDLLVQNPTEEAINACDVVLFACPPDVTAQHADFAIEQGIACLDLSGALTERAGPPLLPLVDPAGLERFREDRIAVLPRPLPAAIASLLAPVLSAAGPCAVRGTALLPVSVAGRAGVDELAQEVVSLFNQREPPHQVFPKGLAFDLEPRMLTGLVDGVSFEERTASAQASLLTGLPEAAVHVTCALVPQFVGLTLSLHLLGDLKADVAREIWSKAPAVEVLDDDDDRLRPRSVGGIPAVHVGRIRDDPGGQGVHVWATTDSIAFGVAANVVAVLGALAGADLI